MTKFVGRLGTLGIAVESTRGTAVNPVFWVPDAKMSFFNKVDEAREDQGLGKIADGDSKYVTMTMGEGNIDTQIYDKALGAILSSLLGASPTTGGSYLHTYTLSNTNTHKSLSLYWADPDRSYMFPLAMIDSLKMTVKPSGLVEWTFGFKSKSARDWTSQTPNFTSLGNKFLHQDVQFKLAANIAAISAASTISLKSLELDIKKNTEYDTALGTVEPEDILNQQLSVEGKLQLNLTDDTYQDYMLNGTYRSMEVKLYRSASSILTMQFPRVDFSQWQPDYTLNKIATQSINFKCNYDAANALDIISTCTLQNGQAGGSY